jgi:hypothetical protein
MSIKGAIKRLEGVLARNNGKKILTFVMPFCRNKEHNTQIQRQIILDTEGENQQDVLRIFIIDFASSVHDEGDEGRVVLQNHLLKKQAG